MDEWTKCGGVCGRSDPTHVGDGGEEQETLRVKRGDHLDETGRVVHHGGREAEPFDVGIERASRA